MNLHAGLLSYHEFEDNYEDSFSYEKNGVPDGNNTFQSGKVGKAISLDGDDDYVEIGENYFDPRNSSGEYSISMWVYSTSAASSSNNNCYIGKHDDSRGNIFLLGYWSSTLRLQIDGTYATVSSTSEPVNQWVHYAVTADEGSSSTYVKVYRNGSQIWSGTINDTMGGAFSPYYKPWVIGMDWDVGTPNKSDHFKGKIDSVRFYDSELSANYVQQIYLKESSDIYLPFDDTYEEKVTGGEAEGFNGTEFVTGHENRALFLDGSDDYVEFGDDGTLDPRGTNGIFKDYSISLWVKSNNPASSGNNNCYIGKHESDGGNTFLLGYWSSTLRLQIDSTYATISTATEPTSWTHYVVTGREFLDASLLTFKTNAVVYKNGSQIWSGTINDTMGNISGKRWVLGMDWDSSTSKTDHFYGDIDNVRFYNRILSATEAQQLYVSEFTGIRFCNGTQYQTCTVTTDIDYDVSDSNWWVYNGLIHLPVSQNNVESIAVSEGWETYLCTSTNHQGTCHYYEDGIYDYSTGLESVLVDTVYSMTPQPKYFHTAKKYFGLRRPGESGYKPTGYAYFYQYQNYTKPTQSNDHRRLFMDNEYRDNFQNMSNTILGAYRTTGAELYGNTYAILYDNSYNEKHLYTSHRDFGQSVLVSSPYTQLDFRLFNDNVKQIYLEGDNQIIGSVGWFIANDVSDPGERDYVCLKGIDEVEGYDDVRIECMTYGSDYVAFGIGAGDDEFFERVHAGNQQKFDHYADNYSLLMLTGHGNFYMDGDETLAKIYIPYEDDDYKVYFTTKDDLRFNYSSKLGQQSTRWMETTGCKTFGEGDDDYPNDPDYVEWEDVGDAYYNVLKRLNGVGGYRNNSSWGVPYDYYNYYDHWDDLIKSDKTISKAWVDSWSEDLPGDADRDARFLTLETCDCTDSNCTGTYMKNDYFYNVETGPMDQKTTTSGYNYYCFRDRGVLNLNSYTRNVTETSESEVYHEKFSAYTYETIPDSVVESVFGTKINGKETLRKNDDSYSFEDEETIVRKKDKNIKMKVNRRFLSFENSDDWEYEARDKIDEATSIAESLTTLDIELSHISQDINTSYEVGGDGEQVGRHVNSVSFVFRPKINGLPVFVEDISIEYDAGGLYQIRSRVPYSITLSRSGNIKSEEKVLEEALKSVTIEEAEKGKMMYTMNENGELELSYLIMDEENKKFISISMGGNDE